MLRTPPIERTETANSAVPAAHRYSVGRRIEQVRHVSGLRSFFASPFSQDFNWIRNAVARACREHDIEFRAVDETVTPGQDIASSIRQEIEEADIGIAVVSSYNPNVMYELGRLHQASKPTIILNESGAVKQMPFDIQGFARIEYDAGAKAESSLVAAVGSAWAKVKKALPIQGGQLIEREGRTPPLDHILRKTFIDVIKELDSANVNQGGIQGRSEENKLEERMHRLEAQMLKSEAQIKSKIREEVSEAMSEVVRGRPSSELTLLSPKSNRTPWLSTVLGH
jgi:hypothetical protein